LLSQHYPNLEVILVNDHSTDNTSDIIRQIQHPLLQTYEAERRGAGAARNLAYNKSRGELIVFFDADDIVDSDFIEKQVQKWYGSPENSVVISKWGRFYQADQSDFKENLLDIVKNLSFYDWVIKYWAT